MNKKLGLILLAPLLLSSLVGCSNKEEVYEGKIYINYGKVHLTDEGTVEVLDYMNGYDGLADLVKNGRTFVVIISNNGCGCWTRLQPIASRFNYEYNLDIRHIDWSSLLGVDTFGLDITANNQPSIAFFVNGKLNKQYLYNSNSPYYEKFNDYEAYKKFMLDNVVIPNRLFIDENVIAKFESLNKEYDLYVTKYGCPDCNMVNAMYVNSWSITASKNLYLFDIYKYVNTDQYDKKKKELLLTYDETLNPVFGYSTGFVPTFQHRVGSTLEDMICVLNDKKDNETKKVTRTYFTEERVRNMPCLEEFKQEYVLEDKELSDIELSNWSSTQYKLQLPMLEQYFKTYLK